MCLTFTPFREPRIVQMPDDISEAIALWIALGKPKIEFPRDLTPELDEYWSKIEKEIMEIEDKGFEVEIPFN